MSGTVVTEAMIARALNGHFYVMESCGGKGIKVIDLVTQPRPREIRYDATACGRAGGQVTRRLRFTEAEIASMVRRHQQGDTWRNIARLVGCNEKTARAVVLRSLDRSVCR